MSKKIIRIDYVQLIEKTPKGIIAIGQPVTRKFGLEAIEKLFGGNPNIIPFPSVAPNKLRKVI